MNIETLTLEEILCDEKLIWKFMYKNGRLFKKHFPDWCNSMYEYSPWLVTESFIEKLYVYFNKLSEAPVCKICGNIVEFYRFNVGYKNYCCKACKDEDIKRKREKTCLKRYGKPSAFHIDEVQQKVKDTIQDRYGVENIAKLQETKDKISNTMMRKYGKTTYSQTDECKEKIKITNLKRYGIEHYTKTKDF